MIVDQHSAIKGHLSGVTIPQEIEAHIVLEKRL